RAPARAAGAPAARQPDDPDPGAARRAPRDAGARDRVPALSPAPPRRGRTLGVPAAARRPADRRVRRLTAGSNPSLFETHAATRARRVGAGTGSEAGPPPPTN